MSTLTTNLFPGSINKTQGDTLQICSDHIVQIIRPIIRVRMIQLTI